jgi:hypothetical protein
MPLFNPEDIELTQRGDDSSRAVRMSNLKAVMRMGKARSKVAEVIGDLAGVEMIDYVSFGRWSMHDLLFYLLEQTGPAKVYFTTWAISTKSINLLVEGLASGLISELHSILDRRIEIRRSDCFAFLQHHANSIYLVDCHAKVILIENDHWKIVVKSSANFSENRRIETGMIIINKEIFNFNKKWIEETIANANPFEL